MACVRLRQAVQAGVDAKQDAAEHEDLLSGRDLLWILNAYPQGRLPSDWAERALNLQPAEAPSQGVVRSENWIGQTSWPSNYQPWHGGYETPSKGRPQQLDFCKDAVTLPTRPRSASSRFASRLRPQSATLASAMKQMHSPDAPRRPQSARGAIPCRPASAHRACPTTSQTAQQSFPSSNRARGDADDDAEFGDSSGSSEDEPQKIDPNFFLTGASSHSKQAPKGREAKTKKAAGKVPSGSQCSLKYRIKGELKWDYGAALNEARGGKTLKIRLGPEQTPPSAGDQKRPTAAEDKRRTWGRARWANLPHDPRGKQRGFNGTQRRFGPKRGHDFESSSESGSGLEDLKNRFTDELKASFQSRIGREASDIANRGDGRKSMVQSKFLIKAQ